MAITIRLDCAADEADLVSGILWSLGTTGVAEQASAPGRVEILAGFDDGGALGRCRRALPHLAIETADTRPSTWRTHALPHRAGRFRVRLPEHPAEDHGTADSMDLVIEPGDTFGTGSHPSTRLALSALGTEDLHRAAVADVGCGTGVLGIAAARLGAVVDAVDIDAAAVARTRANAVRNGVTISARVGSVAALPRAGYDLALVNMTMDGHRAAATELRRRLAPAARVVIAGILGHQVDDALGTYGNPTVVTRSGEGEWVCLTVSP